MPRNPGQLPLRPDLGHVHHAFQIIGEGDEIEEGVVLDFVTRAELESLASDDELADAISAALDNIELGDTFITNVVEHDEFITQLITETFVTELTENNTYVTNVTNIINSKKGQINELATLNASGKHTAAEIPPGNFQLTIDGGGVAITTGVKLDFIVPFNCNLTGWTLLADQSGSIVIDVWKDSYANFPPVVGDSISTSKPTLSSAVKAQDLTITDWSEALVAGDILRFNVDSAATVTRVTLILNYERT